MEKEKVKLGTIERKVSKDKVYYLEAPNEVNNLLGRYLGEYNNNFTCFSYNGGGDLVNYGLNTFVRDLYMIDKHVVYSDRFGNYNVIEDKQISKIIANSYACISPEGVILFYNNSYIYATINCKTGCIVDVSSIVSKRKNYTIEEIIILNKVAYLKIQANDNSEDVLYYALSFSFNFFESYGTQVYINFSKVKEKYIECFDGECDYELETETFNFDINRIQKSDEIKKINCKTSNYSIEDFIEIFGEKSFCEQGEVLDPRSEFYTKFFYFDGDNGINNCINSFIKEIYTVSPLIARKEGFFKRLKNVVVKNAIVLYDRLKNSYMQMYQANETLYYISESKLFVSQEGVIVALYDYNFDIFVLVSLDGIVWKKYNLKSMFNNRLNSNLEIKQKNSNLRICSYKNCMSNDEQNNFEIIINFTFNFWDLYGSPVEASFTLIE